MGANRYGLDNVQHATKQIADLTGMTLIAEKIKHGPYQVLRDGKVWLQFEGAAEASERLYLVKDVLKDMTEAGYMFIRATGARA